MRQWDFDNCPADQPRMHPNDQHPEPSPGQAAPDGHNEEDESDDDINALMSDSAASDEDAALTATDGQIAHDTNTSNDPTRDSTGCVPHQHALAGDSIA